VNLRIVSILAALALVDGCATQKPSGRMEDVVQSRATVTAIDAQSRLVTLRDQNGEELVIQVPDAVRNFNQIKVGDEVVASYTEAIAWQVKPAGQATPGVTASDDMTTAQPGQRPAATVGSSVTVTATITAIDLAKGTVTLTGPGGRSQTIKARDPSNLRRVKVGDLVEITYSEAVAVSVQPVAKQ
jgi:hypothetical protein